ncbi:tyrosine-type recombinase/integrase [Aliagarivorans taiwanensis]|uniref:tyrosine-type recombinase/integrase n=1 Tax=Aliagarivorans taiwanensis TaxID=561966 RepID=UPI00041BAD38|nr:site-specific integrase [Aliagarivorans taiwanensis]
MQSANKANAMPTQYTPPPLIPLFESGNSFNEANSYIYRHLQALNACIDDDVLAIYDATADYLEELTPGSPSFTTMRSEATLFLIWLWRKEERPVPLRALNKRHLLSYLQWCSTPQTEFITDASRKQFIKHPGYSDPVPNPNWRPFVVTKGNQWQGLSPERRVQKLALLSMLFNHYAEYEITPGNPAAPLLKAEKRKVESSMEANSLRDKAMTQLEWSYVIETAEQMAEQHSEHERTLFLISLMYSCYPRISEVAARPSYELNWGHFRRIPETTSLWQFHVLGKGRKWRAISVSKALLRSITRYRKYLRLSDLPSLGEQTPLFIRTQAAPHGRHAGVREAGLGKRRIHDLVALVFNNASDRLKADGFEVEALRVKEMSAHSIRHTGITHDANYNERPLLHIQADAGHDSIETTSLYLWTDSKERVLSASDKKLDTLRDQLP